MLGAGIEAVSMGVVLPFAKCDLNLSNEEQGMLFAISSLGIVAFSHAWGFLADTWGRQKVLRLAATGAFFTSFLSGLAPNKISMMILRFFAGAL